MMKGRYDLAIRKDEELIWSKKDGEYIAQILIVGFFSLFSKFDLIIIHPSQSTFEDVLLPATPALLPSTSTAPSDSGLDSQTFGEQVLKNPLLVQVANALGIDSTLTHRTDSLRVWYKKYKAYNEAVATLTQMKIASTWKLAEIGRTELINIFGGRSFWHSHVRSGFGDIQNHKFMVEWLERDEDDEDPSDLDVWHLQKPHYTFKDLVIWKKEGTLDKEYQKQLRAKERAKEKAKEKAKARVRQNERKGRDRKVVSEDSMDEAETSKKGKQVSSGKTKKSVSKSSNSKSRK